MNRGGVIDGRRTWRVNAVFERESYDTSPIFKMEVYRMNKIYNLEYMGCLY